MNLQEFELKLSKALQSELLAALEKLESEKIHCIDIGVHPWHGYFEVSILLQEEMESKDSSFAHDIAAWKNYNINNFQVNIESPLYKLGNDMEKYFNRSKYFRYDLFFQISARVINSAPLMTVLAKFDKSEEFYTSVFDPDDMKYRNYCTGYKRSWIKNIAIFRFLDIMTDTN